MPSAAVVPRGNRPGRASYEVMSPSDLSGTSQAVSGTEIAPEQRLPFEFVGNSADYFRISVANLFLTLVTVGFYSPWAKCATRYFHEARCCGSAFASTHRLLHC